MKCQKGHVFTSLKRKFWFFGFLCNLSDHDESVILMFSQSVTWIASNTEVHF